MDNLKTKHLIKACTKGNQLAQIQLYDLYCNAMFNVACRYLNDKEDAKDVMQDGFLKAFANIKNYTDVSTFGAWLKRIIINCCLDKLREKQLETESIDVENYQIVEVDDDWDLDVKISKKSILSAIETLKEKYKIIVKLYLCEGFDHEEISGILNIPVKTSRTQLHRAKLQLRELLKP